MAVLRFLVKLLVTLGETLWFLLYWTLRLLVLSLMFLGKAIAWLLGWRNSPSPKTAAARPLEVVFPDEPLVEPPSQITSLGKLSTIEEDPDLRPFTLMNAEGEIFRIDTSLPGPFHGPSWTRIFSAYEKQEVVRARLEKPLYSKKDGYIYGYQVRLGLVKAFMPRSHSLRGETLKPIPICVLIKHIEPTAREVIVSAKDAYYSLCPANTTLAEGKIVSGIFWNYDSQNVHLLLPGRYVGIAPHQLSSLALEELMGQRGEFTIVKLRESEREAQVSWVSPALPLAPGPPQEPKRQSDLPTLAAIAVEPLVSAKAENRILQGE